MARIEYGKIKARHAAADDTFASEVEDETITEALNPVTANTREFILHSHDDMDDLIKEHDRFVSNYISALAFLDHFVNHYGNTLPEEIADEARSVQVRMRGLL